MRRWEMWWLIRFASPFGMAAAVWAFAMAPPVETETVPMDLRVWVIIYEHHATAALYALFCIGLFLLSTRRLERLGRPS